MLVVMVITVMVCIFDAIFKFGNEVKKIYCVKDLLCKTAEHYAGLIITVISILCSVFHCSVNISPFHINMSFQFLSPLLQPL